VSLLQKRGHNLELLKTCILLLEKTGILPAEYSPHKLSGVYNSYWEAHLKSDWLIIWKPIPDKNEIWLTRTGSHSDLFK
jgi:mRNA interferase YafQ